MKFIKKWLGSLKSVESTQQSTLCKSGDQIMTNKTIDLVINSERDLIETITISDSTSASYLTSVENSCDYGLNSEDTIFNVSSLSKADSSSSEVSISLRRLQIKNFVLTRYRTDPKFRRRCKKIRVNRRLQTKLNSKYTWTSLQKEANLRKEYKDEENMEEMSSCEEQSVKNETEAESDDQQHEVQKFLIS